MADESRLERWFRTITGKIITALLIVGVSVVVLKAATSNNNNDKEVEFTRDSLITVVDSISDLSALKDVVIMFLEERNDTLEKAKEITNKTLDSLKIVNEANKGETRKAKFQLEKAKTSEDSLRAALIILVRQDAEILSCGLTVASCFSEKLIVQEQLDNTRQQKDLLQGDRDIWKKQAKDNLVALDNAIKKLQCTIVFGIKCPSRNAAAISGLVLGLVGGYFIFSSSDETTIIVQQEPHLDEKINY